MGGDGGGSHQHSELLCGCQLGVLNVKLKIFFYFAPERRESVFFVCHFSSLMLNVGGMEWANDFFLTVTSDRFTDTVFGPRHDDNADGSMVSCPVSLSPPARVS